MILVAVVAELLEEYTVVLARVLEHMLELDGAHPLPRRLRFLILTNLPFASSSNSYTTASPSTVVNNFRELKVRICCTGCERVVKNAIFKLRGVDSVEVNLEMEKVTVTSYVDHNKVLKAARRSGKRAEFWPYPNLPLYFTSVKNYFKNMSNDYKQSYNYWRHGYNLADRHGTIHVTHRGDDNICNLFNDDNVNACCVM